jgi:phosphatidylglycerol---prolipoprotein diacylglyceryl transferase
MNQAWYGLFMLAGILFTLKFWWKLFQTDERLVPIFVFGLCGAFVGAKAAFIFAEGWSHQSSYEGLLSGKSILGGLLGGFIAVEIAKRIVGYRAVTGDRFAAVIPFGIIFGRIGCLAHGCCLGKICPAAWYTWEDSQGVARWPAVPLEIGFNLMALFVFAVFRRKELLKGQHFHIYLMAYGTFRFFHEFYRDTPALNMGLNGYQVISLFLIAAGGIAALVRAARLFEAVTPNKP